MRKNRSLKYSGTNTAVANGVSIPQYGYKSKARSKKRVKSKEKSGSINMLGITLGIVFVLFSIVMLQNLFLIKMDQDVSSLQIEYETVKAMNDSKESKIIESCNYDAVVPKAKAYGMSEITQDQKIAMEIEKQDRKIKDFYIDSMIQ